MSGTFSKNHPFAEEPRSLCEVDRAIRLYVSGKIPEDRLDHRRKCIAERPETLRTTPDEYRSQHTALVEKRNLMQSQGVSEQVDSTTIFPT